jgi:hypothetical protein
LRRHHRQARDQDDREDRSAPGVDLSDAFPGCETDDPGVLAECLALAGCERSCEMFNTADGLEADCAALCE